MNKQQIIDAAEQIAVGMGMDAHDSPVIDSDMTAEDLLPHAVRHAYKQLLNMGELSLQDVLRSHTISVVDGEGDLPEEVLREYLEHSFLPDFPYSSYQRYFGDYNRQRYNNLLCYFTVNNDIFYTSCTAGSSEELSEESSEEGEPIVLHAPSLPTIPADAVTDIEMPPRALALVINTLASALRGDVKLVQ